MTELVVVGLGPVDPALVEPVLGPGLAFRPEPDAADLAVAQGAIVRAAFPADAAALAGMPRLRVLARTGVGTERVDLDACAERGIEVVTTPGSNANAVAEGVFAHALHLVKRLGELHPLVRDGRWAHAAALRMGDLEGATMGVVGYGRIGRRVAEVACAFGMRVLAADPVAEVPADRRASLAELLAGSDVVTLHAPLVAATRRLVGPAAVAAMRPGAILVNLARGGLVDQHALLDGLESGRLGGVGLDVFEDEPPAHHPLFDHPRVLLTPHATGISERALRATVIAAAQGVRDVLTTTADDRGTEPSARRKAQP